MRICLEAAGRGRGRVSPNPLVGAAVVRGGRLVATGHHARHGGDHAEVVALRRAGTGARGATLYVNLEPCAHHGKTPPCVEYVQRAGIRRVVAAMRDPHPLVNGRGFRALRGSGVQVTVGVLRAEARRLNEAYVTALTLGRPLVTLKSGMTLDGRIATAAHRSRWITSEVSRREGHRLRAEHDAVLVGIGTASRDRPLLTVRARGLRSRRPLRVVLDSDLRLDPASPLLRRGGGGAVLVYAARALPGRRARLEAAGAEVILAGPGREGVNLRRVLADLARRGVHALLVEGGSEIAWSFLRARAVDKIAFFVAPRIVGGRGAVPAVGGQGVRTPEDAFRVGDLEVGRIGPDLLVKGRLLPGARAGRRAVGGPERRRAPARAAGGRRRLRRGGG